MDQGERGLDIEEHSIGRDTYAGEDDAGGDAGGGG